MTNLKTFTSRFEFDFNFSNLFNLEEVRLLYDKQCFELIDIVEKALKYRVKTLIIENNQSLFEQSIELPVYLIEYKSKEYPF